MKICLIEVPYAVGDDRHPASRGPARYLDAGAEQLIAALGIEVIRSRVERIGPFRDSVSASRAVGEQLARAVRRAEDAGQFPFVLAGSCDASIGLLAGLDRHACGAVWVDAHGDFNTPDSTVSGFFPGMSLAVLTGHCYQQMWRGMGNAEPVPESTVVMLGVRDLSPEEEARRLERSSIEVVGWRDGEPTADVATALDQLAERVGEVYLHVDNDGLDPSIAPGVSDPPAPGGLSLDDVEGAIRSVASRFRIRASALTNYNPEHDQDDETLRTGLRIIPAIASAMSTVA